MSDRKDVDLSCYGISSNRYRQLKYFCLQYPEWQQELKNINLLQDVKTDNEDMNLRKKKLEKNCKLLDEIIKKIEDLEIGLRKNILNGESIDFLNISCNQYTFGILRKKFFCIIIKKIILVLFSDVLNFERIQQKFDDIPTFRTP